MGSLVAGGELALADAWAALIEAGRHVGLDDGEVLRSVESGLEGGMKFPRRRRAVAPSRVIQREGHA
jgi:hypothetical protein